MNFSASELATLQSSLGMGTVFAMIFNLNGSVTLALGPFDVASTPGSAASTPNPAGNGTTPQTQVTIPGSSADLTDGLFLTAWMALANANTPANAVTPTTFNVPALLALAALLDDPLKGVDQLSTSTQKVAFIQTVLAAFQSELLAKASPAALTTALQTAATTWRTANVSQTQAPTNGASV